MQQFGGKDSKRHFTVVMEGKEHGLYISSTPSSAAKKAVTKLCTANKSKKVEFSMREITQGSKKKTYGPYKGYIEKLKEPIELKGRVIKYKPFVKLVKKEGGGFFKFFNRKIQPVHNSSSVLSDSNKLLYELCLEIDNFKSKIAQTEINKRISLVTEAKELLKKILIASQSCNNPAYLKEFLDGLYYIKSYMNINVQSTFNIIKEKYDRLLAQDQTKDYAWYPTVYPSYN
jgi:hypothetical protein